MFRLLKTDLKRILKDKLFIVVCIIGVIFAFISPVLYKVLYEAINELKELGLLGSAATAKGLYFASFNIADNFGFLLPILLVIVVFKDFGYGTIRNKIIYGHSRTAIYISSFISTFIVLWGLIIFHALLQFGLGYLFFGYGVEITFTEVCYFFVSTLFMLLAYLFVTSILSFLTSILKHSGTCVILYIAIVFGFTIIGAITLLAGQSIELFTEGNEILVELFDILTKLNIFTNVTSIGSGLTYSFKEVAIYLTSTLAGTILFGGLGLLIFNKKHIK